jgi:hypothetical protein
MCKNVDWMQHMDESELEWQELPKVMIFLGNYGNFKGL